MDKLKIEIFAIGVAILFSTAISVAVLAEVWGRTEGLCCSETVPSFFRKTLPFPCGLQWPVDLMGEEVAAPLAWAKRQESFLELNPGGVRKTHDAAMSPQNREKGRGSSDSASSNRGSFLQLFEEPEPDGTARTAWLVAIYCYLFVRALPLAVLCLHCLRGEDSAFLVVLEKVLSCSTKEMMQPCVIYRRVISLARLRHKTAPFPCGPQVVGLTMPVIQCCQ